MKYAILPSSVSSVLYGFGNMNEFSFTDSEDPIETMDSNTSLYSSSCCTEAEFDNNFYQQPADNRAFDIPLHCPMMEYQTAGPSSLMTTERVDDSYGFIQQPFSLGEELSIPQRRNNLQGQKNPKKRLNTVQDQRGAKKKVANQEQLHNQDYVQAIERLRERVPMRRSQKLSDKITALQKLVSPYGKTDTASVLQEACISIKLLHNQIQKLLQKMDTSSTTIGSCSFYFQNNEDAKISLRSRGLCLVPISTTQNIVTREEQINNNPFQDNQQMMPRSY